MNNIDFGSLNYLAIIVGIIFNQVLGAAWYSALSKPWMAEVGLTQEDMEAMKGTAQQWYPYVVAIVSAIVFTFGLALLDSRHGRGKRSRRPLARPPGIRRVHPDVVTQRPTASRDGASSSFSSTADIR